MRFPDLEIDLLRAFVAVSETGSFTAAADVVGRSQSAVSQKVLRLEEILGRRVFDRNSRSLCLTKDGERLLTAARRMLDFNDETVRHLIEPAAVGSLALGIAEDFIPRQLPKLLSRFVRLYPGVHLDLKTGLSCDLLTAFDAGTLDVVIAKKDGLAQRGRVIWREPLAWMTGAEFDVDFAKPLPLVVLRPPCTYRQLMLDTLDRLHRPWTIVCTASSLMGVQAAVAGGLGVTVLGGTFLQDGMRPLNVPGDWPSLPMTEITLLGEDTAAAALVRPLVAFLTESLTGTLSAAIA